MEPATTSLLDTQLPSDWSPSEIVLWQDLVQRLEKIRPGKNVVLVTGVFDLFHKEHQNFLERAKQSGDVLVVGIESDNRVKALKGPGRPAQNQSDRLQQVTNFSAVDFAAILPESFSRPEHHRAIIHLVRPDVLAVSSHSPHLDKKQAILEEVRGRVQVVHEHNPLVSTTELIKRRTITQ